MWLRMRLASIQAIYPETDGPRYLNAMASNAAVGFSMIASAWVLRICLQSTNRKIMWELGPSNGVNEGLIYAYRG